MFKISKETISRIYGMKKIVVVLYGKVQNGTNLAESVFLQQKNESKRQ